MFSWTDLTTATGAAGVAAVVLVLVQLSSTVWGALITWKTQLAFLYTGAVYGIGAFVLWTGPFNSFARDANGLLSLFLSWVACATITLGINAGVTGQGVSRGTAPPA